MSQQLDSPHLTADTAEEILRHRLVRFNAAGKFVYCDAGEMPLGPVPRRVANGDPAAAEILRNKPGTIQVVCAGAYARGARVFTAADGKVSTTNSGILVGELLAASGGDGAIVECLPDLRRVPYVNVAPSAVITDTSVETAFDKSLHIPAAELVAGSVLRVKASGIVLDQNSTNTCVLRLKAGTETILTTAALQIADNDQFMIMADIVIREVGETGKLVAVAGQAYDAAGDAFDVNNKAEATEDMTAGLTLSLTAQFSAAHADNQIRLEILEVEHLR